MPCDAAALRPERADVHGMRSARKLSEPTQAEQLGEHASMVGEPVLREDACTDLVEWAVLAEIEVETTFVRAVLRQDVHLPGDL